jgi:hypothetical protein
MNADLKRDLCYRALTVLIVIIALAVIYTIWGDETREWLGRPLGRATLGDLLAMLVVIVFFNDLINLSKK